MPEKVHDCVDQIKGEHGEDSAWAICNDSISETKICEICKEGEHEPTDHPYIPSMDESVLAIAGITESHDPLGISGIREHHNPLDIPFGHEAPTTEVNMNPKDPEDETDEGGLGSGRNPEGGDSSGGAQAGPLISFGETIIKELVDAKINCPCHKNSK